MTKKLWSNENQFNDQSNFETIEKQDSSSQIVGITFRSKNCGNVVTSALTVVCKISLISANVIFHYINSLWWQPVHSLLSKTTLERYLQEHIFHVIWDKCTYHWFYSTPKPMALRRYFAEFELWRHILFYIYAYIVGSFYGLSVIVRHSSIRMFFFLITISFAKCLIELKYLSHRKRIHEQ